MGLRFTIIVIFLIAFGSVRAADTSSYFFVFLNTNLNRPTIERDSLNRLQAGHLANITRLYNEGKLVVAGPFGDSLAGGVSILKSGSLDAAHATLGSDPAIRAGRYVLELFPLAIRHGSFCAAPDENDMAKYPFARLAINTTVSKEHRALHEQYYSDLAQSKNILFLGNLE